MEAAEPESPLPTPPAATVAAPTVSAEVPFAPAPPITAPPPNGPGPQASPPGTSGTRLVPQESSCWGSSSLSEGPRPRATLDFEDRRAERQRAGHLKWKVEHGVPDVGGLGWRSRNGHLLKNQTFYATRAAENLWDNPTHAGPKTWKEYHGPRLRNDAPLMARLDRLDAAQEEWEAKKSYVISSRVQTLDRFYHQKVENQQKEMASQWAPHRRARKEVHNSFDTFAAELDSMPMKELKKVLTETVLRGDREAIRMIAKRVQVEETWKTAWREMEKERHADTRAGLEQRMAFNDMLMELAGQPPRPRNAAPGAVERKLPAASARLEELAVPTGPRHAITSLGLTKMADFAGLIHVDHKFALEARFPGEGHDMSVQFTERASESARPGYPPPPPAETPRMSATRQRSRGVGTGGLEDPAGAVRKASAPVTRAALEKAKSRMDDEALSRNASLQFLPSVAPPAPEQRDLVVAEPVANELLAASQDFSLSRGASLSARRSSAFGGDHMDVAPLVKPVVYPVVVPTVEAAMQRPNWRPRRGPVPSRSANPRRPIGSAGTAALGSTGMSGASAASEPATARERWPPIGTQTVMVTVVQASGLPNSDRTGHSDPYTVCQVLDKPRSKVRTRVVAETENPEFREALYVQGWREGDSLLFSVFDHDDLLATVEVPSAAFFPGGFSGTLPMVNKWSSRGQGNLEKHVERANLDAQPILEVHIEVQDGVVRSYEDANAGKIDLSMPGADPSLRAVCSHLDDFEAGLVEVPRLGNFWMAQRGEGPGGRRPAATAPMPDVQSAR